LWGLINYDKAEDVDNGKYAYDMVTGVSGGSINALGIATFPKGTEREMADWLSKAWRGLKTSEVFKLWDTWFPIYHGIT
jgi:predicted acylesterase/phospholipase RssA